MSWCRQSRRFRIALYVSSILLLLGVAWYFLLFRESKDTCKWTDEEAEKKPFPRIIHRMWKNEDIPERFRDNWESCKTLNPNYNVTLWTDAKIEEFIKTHYPWFLPLYNSYPYPVERFDAARYIIILHFGGVYIDMDVKCRVSFDKMFNETSNDFDVMIGGGLPVGLTNSFFAARARHPFMRLMVDRLFQTKGYYLTPYWSVMMSTGTLYITFTHMKYPCKEKIYTLAPRLHKEVYMIHEHAGTWHKWDGPIFVWIDRRLRYVVGSALFLIFAVVVYCTWTRYKDIKSTKYSKLSIKADDSRSSSPTL